jgi:hypothetical protein
MNFGVVLYTALLNARYYNGAQGQFTSEDPVFWGQQNLGDPQSLNAYACGRRPANSLCISTTSIYIGQF